MLNCGIYRIYNTENDKSYIGSSINIKKRSYKHFWMLNNGSHYNDHLQKSYIKYGKDKFVFEIVDICSEYELIVKENFYIDKYKSNLSDFGYNLAKVNDFRRNSFNDEVKVKLSIHNKLKNNNFNSFSLTNIETGVIFIFECLVDAAKYLIDNGFTVGSHRNVRLKISNALRGIKVNNGYNGSIRKTCYKHYFKIIN